MKTTLYQLHLTGRLKHMIIEVKENEILTEWWTSKEDEDGKKQSTKETVYGKNRGRIWITLGVLYSLYSYYPVLDVQLVPSRF